ncbi:hypothetical protein AR1_027 [Escherichia phage AR1]|uniref:Uncharacterized protein n=1 Tax=Escherichia phage AR1 TaxID=66711 RepID=D4Z9H3_BPAR1|nr:hypothetical protein AR1_027 [Escherichia phage AR1]BAI83035.1 hypothetical protein AR1_027 [Escherichia phage AR1]
MSLINLSAERSNFFSFSALIIDFIHSSDSFCISLFACSTQPSSIYIEFGLLNHSSIFFRTFICFT